MAKKRTSTTNRGKWTFTKVLVWSAIAFIIGVLMIPLVPEVTGATVWNDFRGFFADVNSDFTTNIYLYVVLAAVIYASNLLLYKIPAGKVGKKIKYEADLKGLLYFGVLAMMIMTVAVPLLPVTAIGVGDTANAYQNFHLFFSDIKVHLAANLNLYFGSIGLVVFLYWFFFKKK